MADKEAIFRARFEPIRGDTLGPQVMGMFADAVLCGVLIIQIYHWTSWSVNEKRLTKVLVGFCFVLTMVTTIFNLAFVWSDLVAGWGKYANLMSVRFISWYRIFDCFVAAGTQLFFVDRAGKLSGWPKTIWIIFTPLVFGACGASITNFFILRHNSRTGDFTTLNGDPALTTWIAMTVGLDAALSGIIIYNLIQSRTGWANTDATIKRLVRVVAYISVSLEAQVPSVLVAISFLIAFQFRGDTRIPVFFDLAIGKIYVVCLMSLLNAKISLKRDMDTVTDSFFGTRSGKYKAAAVMVSTEVYTESHQLQRLPAVNQPRRPPIAEKEEEDIESVMDININLGETMRVRERDGSFGMSTAPAVRFNDMVKE